MEEIKKLKKEIRNLREKSIEALGWCEILQIQLENRTILIHELKEEVEKIKKEKQLTETGTSTLNP